MASTKTVATSIGAVSVVAASIIGGAIYGVDSGGEVVDAGSDAAMDYTFKGESSATVLSDGGSGVLYTLVPDLDASAEAPIDGGPDWEDTNYSWGTANESNVRSVDTHWKSIDADGDGVLDAFDECRGTTLGSTINAAGCALGQGWTGRLIFRETTVEVSQ